jgi:hypothetical protein
MGWRGAMDEPEGFFPERKLLAFRRSLLRADPESGAAARQNSSVWWTWWILLVCMGPSYFSIWVSMYPRHIPDGRLPPILIYGSFFLVAGALIVAVLGIFLGIYTGLRTQRLFTLEKGRPRPR